MLNTQLSKGYKIFPLPPKLQPDSSPQVSSRRGNSICRSVKGRKNREVSKTGTTLTWRQSTLLEKKRQEEEQKRQRLELSKAKNSRTRVSDKGDHHTDEGCTKNQLDRNGKHAGKVVSNESSS